MKKLLTFLLTIMLVALIKVGGAKITSGPYEGKDWFVLFYEDGTSVHYIMDNGKYIDYQVMTEEELKKLLEELKKLKTEI